VAAHAFDSKFDTTDLDVLNRRLSRVSKEAAKAVAKSNREWAKKLVTRIGPSMPHTGAKSLAKQGSKHDTRPGAFRRVIRATASADSAAIRGGGKSTGKAPHFYAVEFGGGVTWSSPTTSKRHRIGVYPRSPTIKSLGLFDYAGTQRGAAGWFFGPALRKQSPEYVKDMVRSASEVVTAELKGTPSGS